ncbi:MAG: hypothetical protein HFJ25_05525, partial [Clostridia bacterium]|nr:hypothetical protein [Clostridia bacterium]
TILWVKPEEYINKMCREWQTYIMERFIEKRKQGELESLVPLEITNKNGI